MGGTFFIFKILYQINETYLNGYIIDSLDFLALSSVLSSIFVIISQNPISSVLFLITLFISIAGYLILLGLNFIGISYLLVYVGAVSILFLFILMLINVRISELLSNTNKSIPLAIFIIISFIYTFYPMIPDNFISFLEKYQIFFDAQAIFNNFFTIVHLMGGSLISSDLEDNVFYVTGKS